MFGASRNPALGSPEFAFGRPAVSYVAAVVVANEVDVPFVSSVAAVYAPTLSAGAANVAVPFIASTTQVFAAVVKLNRVVASITPTLVSSLHGSGSSWAITIPNDGTVHEGDVLIVAMGVQTVTVGTPSGWTEDIHQGPPSGGNGVLYVFRKTATVADLGTTVTFTASGSAQIQGAFITLRDAATLDSSASSTTNANPITVTLGDTTQDSETVLFFPLTDQTNITGAGWTTPSGFTQLVQTAGGGANTPNLGAYWRSYPDTGTTIGAVSSTNTGSSGANQAAALVITPAVFPYIASKTVLYPIVQTVVVAVGFISSATLVHAPTLTHVEVDVPFIASSTHVYGVFSLYGDAEGTGPGNGGELFLVRLAPNGSTVTSTLVTGIGTGTGTLQLASGSGFPTDHPFGLEIDDELIYVMPAGTDTYSMRGRGLANTTPATHAGGASASWSDHYDMALTALFDIAHTFDADITDSGLTTYPGWLMVFDSSQAYLGGARYPMHVTEFLGVFDSGAGITGTNRIDAAQPNAISTALATSDDCPAALSNPARMIHDVLIGDVGVVRYTNPEASVLDLGPRSVSIQSWFGLKRVDDSDNDVTFTDPDGHVVDTNPSTGPFTATANGEWFEPLGPGIAPDTGLPTPGDVAYTSVTMPGADRFFTYGTPGYNERGWPVCCLAVRQERRRVPNWASWDWHNFNYVYCGFGTDATYCQVVINSNGIVYGSVPEVELPGPQDIDGPDAVWDDNRYYFGASWYVLLYATPYMVGGPSFALLPPVSGGGPIIPVVDFTPGVGSPPVITVNPPVEGGSGGGIDAPSGVGFHVWVRM